MKSKASLLLSFFLLTITAFAQLEKDYKWQVGVNINTVEPATDFAIKERLYTYSHRKDNSYCLGMNISYRLKDNCNVRFASKLTSNRVVETSDEREFNNGSASGYTIDTVDAHQSVFYFSPGVLWDFKYKKLNLYAGFQAVYKYYGLISGNLNKWAYSGTNALEFHQIYYQTEQGGFAIGAGPVAGFAVNIWKCIYVGAEFSSAFSYYKTGGKLTTEKTLISAVSPANNYYNDYSEFQRTDKGYGFSNVLSSVNISISF